jgi:hypothetical protein
MPELKCALADSQTRPFAPQPTLRSIAALLKSGLNASETCTRSTAP